MRILILGGPAYAEPWRVAYPNAELAYHNTSRTLRDNQVWDEGIDAVQFTGGADVTPELYGAPNIASHNDVTRDLNEVRIFMESKRRLLPCFGICRGSQFLRVMAGGRLVQDIEGHGRDHRAQCVNGEEFRVTSTHHQHAVIDHANFFEILTADNGTIAEGWRHTALGHQIAAVQYHPEYMPHDSRGFTFYKELLIDVMENR